MRYGPADAFILADGFDLTATRTDAEPMKEALIEETTTLGSQWETHAAVGVKRWTLSHNGFYDDAADGANAALVGMTKRIMTIGVEGNATGKHFMGFAGAVQATYTRQISRGALHKANATYSADGALDEGRILHPLGAKTADGDTEATSVDNGASSANGGAIYLHVTGLTLGGYDDVTIRVLESADNNTFIVLEEFEDVDGLGAQRIEVAGSIARYVAVEWEFNGTGSDPSITFLAGIARNRA